MTIDNIFVQDEIFRVDTTDHFDRRLKERNVDIDYIIDDLKKIENKVYNYNNTGKEIALIDDEHNLVTIFQVRYDKVVLITVIDKCNVYIKEGTEVAKLKEVC